MNVKSKWTQQRDDFFKKQFNVFFAEWKKKDKKKNTQGEFARQICEIRNKKTGEKCPVTNSYVSEWARGKWFPDQYLPEIAEVLGVKEEDFFFQTHDDFYKLSSEYMTKLGRGELSQFCDEIDLDPRFIYTIRELIGIDFDHSFPTWTEIKPDPNIFSDTPYTRENKTVWSSSAEMDEDVRVFQYEMEYIEDNETKRRLVTFTREDLRFLKDVQDEVVDYVEYLMMKRSKDMTREVEEASRRSQHTQKGGGSAFKLLKPEELNQIDKYHDYNYTYKPVKDGE